MTKKSKQNSQPEDKMTRRHFLKTGMVGIASVSTIRIPIAESKIKYVRLGRTGFKVSNIGYGGSRGNTDPSMIAYAIEKGLNYFDTSEGYSGGKSERMIGKASKGHREKVFITTKVGSTGGLGRLTRDSTREEIMDRAMASYRRLDMPYVDCLMLHGAGDPDLGGFDNPNLWSVFNQLKSEGKVRYFGISTHHHSLVDTAKYVIDSNKIDVMLLAYNYLQRSNVPESYKHKNWLEEYDRVLKMAQSKDIGIVTMKILQGAQQAGVVNQNAQSRSTKLAAAKWSLNNPDVDVALISFSTFEDIDAFAAISRSKIEKEDRAALGAMCDFQNNYACRIGCPAPCMQGCPHHLPVPDILRINMYFEEYGHKIQAKHEYLSTVVKHKSAELCRSCTSSSCDRDCLFGIPVQARLIASHLNLAD